MNTIHAFEYKGHELIILFDTDDDLYVVDIRIDDYDGHMMQGYSGLSNESEAISVAKAFIDGLKHVEETGIQNK